MKEDYGKLMKVLYKSNSDAIRCGGSKINLSQMSRTITTEMALFLTPKELANLSQTCSLLNSKLNVNLVWENYINDYYMPKMLIKDKEFHDNFDISSFPNYKLAAKELHKRLVSTELIKLTENERDILIGIENVLIEELFESIIKLPHTILLPFKLFSSIADLFQEYLVRPVYSNFFLSYFFKTFILPINLRHDELRFNEFNKELKEQAYFYNLQILGLFCILEYLFLILFTIFVTIANIIGIITRILSLEWMSGVNILYYTDTRRSYTDKTNYLGFNEKIQWITSSIMAIGYFIIILIPTFYFKYDTIQAISIKFDGNTDQYYIIYMITSIISHFLSLSFYRMACVLFGPYFVNLICYLLVISLIIAINTLHDYTYCLSFDVILALLCPMWLIELVYRYAVKVFLSIVFPHILVFNLIIRTLSSLFIPHYIISVVKNILAVVVMILPFYLNFVVVKSVLKYIIINVYAIISLAFYLHKQGRILED